MLTSAQLQDDMLYLASPSGPRLPNTNLVPTYDISHFTILHAHAQVLAHAHAPLPSKHPLPCPAHKPTLRALYHPQPTRPALPCIQPTITSIVPNPPQDLLLPHDTLPRSISPTCLSDVRGDLHSLVGRSAYCTVWDTRLGRGSAACGTGCGREHG